MAGIEHHLRLYVTLASQMIVHFDSENYISSQVNIYILLNKII